MQWKSILDKSYSNPKMRAGAHVLFWSFIFGSGYYFSTISFNGYSTTPATWLVAIKSTLILATFYYTLMYFIFPSLLLKKRYVRGSLALVLLIFFYACADSYGDKSIFRECRDCASQLMKNQPVYYHYLQGPVSGIIMSRLFSLGLLYELLIFLSLPIALKTGRSYFRQTVQQLQLAKDNLQLEFNFLKAQVNPHFLFNTLNNIYSLVIHDKKEEAAATIARLSGFMRFALYECNEDKTSLEKEIRLLKDYIELEKLRLNQTRVEFTYPEDFDSPATNEASRATSLYGGAASGPYFIPPLLFMPAFENAFKYSADHLPNSYISMDLQLAGNQLSLTMENSFDPRKPGRPGGIGLQNMQKRLQYYYPDNHSWELTTMNNIFILKLSFILS
ncbi:sensor histidine kinase [Flavitalea flava]